ncbi:hypothetical protein LWI28_000346 [Acer negundo]|uniref:non-specific serine/threonine protein kinase n=1 Tax=Acer negundo TaxID=4023 RepID=A0AAD5NGM0_ACENE|nr:hypothetical protein LWI28_000346 [Acer negundo]
MIFIDRTILFWGFFTQRTHAGLRITFYAVGKGFISLDCGLPRDDNNYTEATTGINYISDANYVETGSGKSILPEYKVAQSGSLELNTRADIGTTLTRTYRYKDDVYDRIWWPLNFNYSRQLSTSTEEQDVDAITNIKAMYGLKKNWQGDPCVPQTFLWDGLSCSNNSNDQPRITSLNLSSSGLSGGIAEYLSNLTMLESLDLSNNSLSGPVPEFLSQLSSLKVLNLERNKLTGLIPAALLDRQKNNSLSLRFDGNPGLCSSDPCKKKKNSRVVIAVVASVVAFVVILAALIGLWVLKRRKQQVKMYLKSSKTYKSLEQNKQQFTYSNVLKMTNNFERVLGKGGFGTVYYGRLDDTEVAVKMLSQSSAQGFKQFQSEVKLLMRVHHKDLTTLIGFCEEGTNLALIYEYMANGNLGEHLLDHDKDILNWETRLRMVVEAAQGLEYLHHGYFGLSRTFPVEGDTHVSTVVAGTPGYLDPEYYMSNRLTEKSDVYSFGVVLLEVITGKPIILKSLDNSNSHLSQWVSFNLAKGDIRNTVDPRMKGEFNINSVWKAVETAMACVSQTSSRRPTMNHVVMELKECLATETARRTENANEFKTGDSVEMMTVNLQNDLSPLARSFTEVASNIQKGSQSEMVRRNEEMLTFKWRAQGIDGG